MIQFGVGSLNEANVFPIVETASDIFSGHSNEQEQAFAVEQNLKIVKMCLQMDYELGTI
jgi:hypothetical protein